MSNAARVLASAAVALVLALTVVARLSNPSLLAARLLAVSLML